MWFWPGFQTFKNAEVVTAEVVNVKEFLTTFIDFGEHMKRKMFHLLELAKENMISYEKMGHYDNATTELPDIPSRQPGLHPTTFSYDQRKLVIQKELFQPNLSSCVKNKSMPAGK